MDEKRENVRDLFEKMNIDPSAANVSKNEDGSIEFQFDAPIPKTGLVFENTDDAEAAEPELEFSVFDMANEEPVADVSATADAIDEIEDDGEFIIPDVFDIAEQSEGLEKMPSDEYVSTIWKAYVPRFTEVTENNYAVEEKKKTVVNERVDEYENINDHSYGNISQITVTKRKTGEDHFDVNDPTAEIKSNVPDAIVVKVNGIKGTNKENLNVFKFSDNANQSKEEPAAEIDSEEKERGEITELTGREWEDVHKKEEEPSIISMVEEEIAPRAEYIGKNAKYTDLVREEKEEFVVHSEIAGERVVPEGYNAKEKVNASDMSEYNSFSMREAFKDRFLDLIMSVKIRFTVAILLGIVTVLFDIFERRICFYFGIGLNFGAPAVIDACLIASVFLLTLPETGRALKHLIFGSITPELSSAIVGITIFAYEISMAIIAPIGGGYPLLASVYVIMAINSIYATYSLHNASFMAFKLVSEKGNKYVLDKPLTRNLELENIALDGLVDEYRSRCARVFSTPFVSGFYSNAYRRTEKSRSNLIILAISFGIALVSGTVMFFVPSGGPVSALSAFALTVSLSMPAFTILSHKLPYADAEREAINSDSAIIGEAALVDYSDVDVVTFEDTEVFGPDDVTFKSASDRRNDYQDTMRKMASLFAAVGGPLCRVFENALNKKYAPAKDVAIEDDGVSGIVEGERVMAGTARYMKRHNVKIPTTNDIKVGSTRVIYAASNGEFFATYTVHYSFSEEFALLLSSMREKGIVPLVYTRDFNINNEFMRILTGGSDVIRVMRKYTAIKEPEVYSRINSSMVIKGEKTSAINLILTAKKYIHFQSVIAVTELSAAAAGAGLAVMIAFTNMISSLPTVLLSLWQICWSIALAISSRRCFKIRKKDKNNADE
ncbi:MAG: hypothetical protein E7673_07000 [Ruminococcaceae bacterium]|nr:hypothetical protein [Oscillospiraceae bacterium]